MRASKKSRNFSERPRLDKNKKKPGQKLNTVQGRRECLSLMDKLYQEIKTSLGMRSCDLLIPKLTEALQAMLHVAYIRHSAGLNLPILIDPYDFQFIWEKNQTLKSESDEVEDVRIADILAERFVKFKVAEGLEASGRGIDVPAWMVKVLNERKEAAAKAKASTLDDLANEEIEENATEDDNCDCAACQKRRRLEAMFAPEEYTTTEDADDDDGVDISVSDPRFDDDFYNNLPAWARSGKLN